MPLVAVLDGMSKEFTIIITKKAGEFEVRCRQMPTLVTRGQDREDALKRFKIALYRKLKRDSGGTDGGAAPILHPVSPPPRGPLISEESREKPDA
jgi:hypothetical protein